MSLARFASGADRNHQQERSQKNEDKVGRYVVTMLAMACVVATPQAEAGGGKEIERRFLVSSD